MKPGSADSSVLRLAALIAVACSVAPAAVAAPGYTYEPIYVDATDDFESLQNCCGIKVDINNNGEVAFLTYEQRGFEPRIARVYFVAPGGVPQLLIETIDEITPEPRVTFGDELGINDDGIVAVPLTFTEFDEENNPIATEFGYRLIEPGVGTLTDIRPLRNSSGKPNGNLQLAGFANSPGRLILTDGATTATSLADFPYIGQAHVQVNAAGAVATAAITATDEIALVRAMPPGDIQVTSIGPRVGLGYTGIRQVTPGFNDLGWASIATSDDNSDWNPNPRVLLIDPQGTIFVVAETAGSDFENFFQPRRAGNYGAALNNFNRVSFVAQLPNNRDALWVSDISGDVPRLVVDTEEAIEFADGTAFLNYALASDLTAIGSNSLNDRGDIVVSGYGSLLDAEGNITVSGVRVLFVARSIAGSEPGNPILPEAADVLPGPFGGWRFRGRCWRADAAAIAGSCDPFGGVAMPTPRVFIDPPIAVGYDYAIDDLSVGAFTSVLIPAALPGGDTEFVVEANGAPATIQAGVAFDFATITPDPVRQFRVSGIDVSEDLDPDNATAFVTGVSFATGTDENVSYTMIPVVFDPTDTDSDGVPDDYDEFPMDPTMSGDPDGDGIDSNTDPDDDGDGVPDEQDDYPWGRFTDTPPAYWSFVFVEALARAGITGGCGGGDYCPSDPVTRAQMAVFIERGINGSQFSPPAASGGVFLDVGAGDFAAAFIERLFADGITGGCGGGNYCPNGIVTRAQMAVFLLRARYGAAYTPPPPIGLFSDVPGDYWAAAWIEQFANDGISNGCGLPGRFCPDAAVTRDQMAVFLVRSFGL